MEKINELIEMGFTPFEVKKRLSKPHGEVNTLPGMTEDFHVPTIAQMLANPACMIIRKGRYDDGDDLQDVDDGWNTDLQNAVGIDSKASNEKALDDDEENERSEDDEEDVKEPEERADEGGSGEV